MKNFLKKNLESFASMHEDVSKSKSKDNEIHAIYLSCPGEVTLSMFESQRDEVKARALERQAKVKAQCQTAYAEVKKQEFTLMKAQLEKDWQFATTIRSSYYEIQALMAVKRDAFMKDQGEKACKAIEKIIDIKHKIVHCKKNLIDEMPQVWSYVNNITTIENASEKDLKALVFFDFNAPYAKTTKVMEDYAKFEKQINDKFTCNSCALCLWPAMPKASSPLV